MLTNGWVLAGSESDNGAAGNKENKSKMKKIFMLVCLISTIILVCEMRSDEDQVFRKVHGEALPQELYVTADTLNVRLCADGSCPSTNKIYRGDRVKVLEEKNGWDRITDFYARPLSGQSSPR